MYWNLIFSCMKTCSGVLTVGSNRGNCEWGVENWERGGGGGVGGWELQNKAREKEKCFIMHYLAAVIKRISEVHQHSALITKKNWMYIQFTVYLHRYYTAVLFSYVSRLLDEVEDPFIQHHLSCPFELILHSVLLNPIKVYIDIQSFFKQLNIRCHRHTTVVGPKTSV